MELKVYDWEYFERSKKRYFIFAFVILLVVTLSILSSNITWWVIVLMVAGGYIFYITKSNDTIKMVTWKNALLINKTTFPYEKLNWFVLEYHTEKKRIHNIVIIDDKKISRIYTIKDTEKNLKNFVNELNEYIPILENYEQTTFDKFVRKLKL
jgi:Ca2+/Na+ antiporter